LEKRNAYKCLLKNPKLRNRITGVEEVGVDSFSWEKEPAVCCLEHGDATCGSIKLRDIFNSGATGSFGFCTGLLHEFDRPLLV